MAALTADSLQHSAQTLCAQTYAKFCCGCSKQSREFGPWCLKAQTLSTTDCTNCTNFTNLTQSSYTYVGGGLQCTFCYIFICCIFDICYMSVFVLTFKLKERISGLKYHRGCKGHDLLFSWSWSW